MTQLKKNMKYINDKESIDKILKNRHMDQIFTNLDLPFRVVEFEKGEVINNVCNPRDHLLFLLYGTTRIYNIREDGSTYEVVRGSKPTMFGDMEFACDQSTQYRIEVEKKTKCLMLPLKTCRKQLMQDNLFLRFVMHSVGQKLSDMTYMQAEPKDIEERILLYMHKHGDRLYGVEKTAGALQISRRQLQRYLVNMCDQGSIKKEAKGKYAINDNNE